MRSVGQSVGQSVGWSVDQLVSKSVSQFVGQLVTRLLSFSVSEQKIVLQTVCINVLQKIKHPASLFSRQL